jgi:transglutaminase-like putative cysteine protease
MPCGGADARTVILEGRLDSRIRVTQQTGFSVDKPVSTLQFRFALPAVFSNRAVHQDLKGMDIVFSPEPASVSEESDAYGNRFKKVVWKNLSSDAKVSVTYETHIQSELSAMASSEGFPLKSVPQSEKVYLKTTDIVQGGSDITSLAQKLTAGTTTEYEAVTAIMNYVSDTVKYTYNPPQFDASYTLRTKSGNCQNFAHLSMALLRAVGIPARVVGGISLKQAWKVPVDSKSFLVQSMGQGGHAWMEVYFPDLGWLSYDPQMSKQFTSTRHIKQTHGLDSNDINDSWRAAPYVPEYSEMLDAKFLDDTVALKSKSFDKAPKSYLFSNNLLATAEIEEPKKPEPIKPVEPIKPKKPAEPKKPSEPKKPVEPKKPEEPGEVKPPKIKPKPKKGTVTEFGNMDFPALVDLYQVVGDRGVRILDKETAEYVTSHYVYAQAFEVEDALKVLSISLAMRKFGGDGTVFVDLVADEGGKPALTGIRSSPLFIENIKKRPGYYWVDFTFPPDTPQKGTGSAFLNLKKGRYWIVLRHSGEAIMNWFYIPGNPYGDSDDTRSTLKGFEWEDIQNYDFVFKVKGMYL